MKALKRECLDVSNKESKTQSFTVSEMHFLTLAVQTLLLIWGSPFFPQGVQVYCDRTPHTLLGQLIQHEVCSEDHSALHLSEPDAALQVLDDTQDNQSLLCMGAL